MQKQSPIKVQAIKLGFYGSELRDEKNQLNYFYKKTHQ